jgi:uncharacterized protein (UPF0332 family)
VGVAADLLLLAGNLAKPGPTDPEQACLRRSVSTAYYSLFHLLVQEAVQAWSGSGEARTALERVFEHKRMKDVSKAIWNGPWKAWSTPSPPMSVELQRVAQAFSMLQEARHEADYDNAKVWTHADVDGFVALARSAFEDWQKIRQDPAANEYLLSLLVGKRRE